MTLLVVLPEVIAFEILSLWLTLSDVARNDIAYSSSRDREQFLSVLSKDTLHSDYSMILDIDEFKWISMRNIALKLLFLYFPHIDSKVYSEFPIITKHLVEFNIANMDGNGQVVADLINSSSKLEVLILDDCDDVLQEINGNVLNRLNKIVIDNVLKEKSSNVAKAETSFRHLVKHCRNLKVVGNSNYFFDGTADKVNSSVSQHDFVELLKNNPNIKSIENVFLYDSNDDLLKGIAKYCPNVENITELFLVYQFSLTTIADVIASCPKLYYLDTVHAESGGSFIYVRPHKVIDKNCSDVTKSSLLSHSVGYAEGELEDFCSKVGGFHSIKLINTINPVTGDLLPTIANQNPNLDTLTIASCHFTDPFPCSDFSYLFDNCIYLTTLSLQDMTTIVDSSIGALFGVERKHITDLNIAQHYGLTTETLIAILEANKQLKSLCFTDCYIVKMNIFFKNIRSSHPKLNIYERDKSDDTSDDDDYFSDFEAGGMSD